MASESKKTIAVIVPCYGYAHYLEECIDSIVNQTYKANEIIIVNDGSKDNTSEVARSIIKKYPNDNIILLEKENGGLASARNAGIALSKSKFYTSVDADDKLVPGALEEHIKLIKDETECAQAALMEFGERHIINVPPEKTTLERVMQANTMFCNTMFPKKAWEEVGGYDESETMRLGYEDWEFNIRVLAAGYKVNTSDFIALRYRVHQGQMTQATSHPNKEKLYEYIYDKHRELYQEKNLLIAGYK